jgi:hypothetical protein
MIRKEFLLSELKYRYPQMSDFARYPQESVKRPLFFEPEKKGAGARIYICAGSQMARAVSDDPKMPLFLCIGEPAETEALPFDMCVFPKQEDRHTLFNFVQRLFDRLDEWSEKLKETAETADDCCELLESAEEMLQNPVWLCDEKWHTVARAERFFSELSDAFLAKSYKMLEDACDESGTTKPFRAKAADDAELLCVRFSAAGARFMLLCASKERPFYGSDEVVFENLSGYVKMMLSEHKISARALRQNRENDRVERQLRALLDQSVSEADATGRLEALGWAEGGRYLTIAAETISGDMRPAFVHTICDRMEAAIDGCCAFGRSPVLAAAVKADGEDEGCLVETIRKFAEVESLRIGVSGPVEGFSFMPQRMLQAVFALSETSPSERTLLRFADVADDYIVRQSLREIPMELTCLRAVWDMAHYDVEHGTTYLETTVEYVKNHFNAVKTANALFIHRSTFLYRLERIQTQFGLRLEGDLSTTLHFLLSLRLAEQMKVR